MKPLFKFTTFIETSEGIVPSSWALISVNESNILEGQYDPDSKTLFLMLNSSKEYREMMPIVTAKGTYKRNAKGETEQQLQRVERYHQIAIHGDEEIEAFLQLYCINH